MSATGLPERVAVIGGGRMGSGIAHAFLMAGADVAVVEQNATAASEARDRILAAVEGSVRRGAAAPDPDRLVVTVTWEALGGAGLAIEVVPELVGLKREALRRAEDLLPVDAVLATNTSSLSIDVLAEGLARPGAFLGLHFFNPVPASALVEVVLGTATAPSAADAATGWVRVLGKTAITVRDSPGFASSRLGVLLGLEAIRMVEEGVATPDDIDTAMELGYKHPVGPLRLTDLVGLDVRLDIAEYLARELGPRYEPPELLRKMVAEGMLGRKSGQGFFFWDEDGTAVPTARERRR
ncbi:3-hydroxyacyl-CoA dehydrogenase family protein [Leifsonia shinshuensis]|uniref:3-hydroxyacyl-CoA dehydrogenase family protein n=1 Tax=Leifsonia shinshuensis TaxID=150026 RepID=UPI00286056AF|nr:3-hydroxyacyl-CoA dehydrogenase family protein [Leifsonia shinshuensis]MDR6971299.1 3-hydroxybutyryl-CoA dehydrogenase [Leifsonia shinshuensis]